MNIKKLLLNLLAAASLAAFSASSALAGAYAQLGDYVGVETIAEVPQVSAQETDRGDRYQPWLSLASFKGSTFLQFLSAPNGLKAAFDRDAKTPFNFVNKEKFLVGAAQFDPAVYAKLAKSIKGGEQGMGELADALNGAQATSITASGPIADKLKTHNLASPSRIGLTAVIFAPVFALLSGSGVPVLLDNNNYFLNVGYKSGANPAELEKDVKSGRSYGASPMHKPLDVSDKYYLQELHQYLTSAPDAAPFYKTMMELLVSCDPSGLAALPAPAQGVLTDFTAVYAAELDRYAMTGFKKHPWQNDLAEATLVSAFAAPSERVVIDGKFVKGDPTSFFGVGTNGSGIGIRRKDRRTLQASVLEYERLHHPELVAKVEDLIGRKGGDVFHNVMLFLNYPSNQPKVQARAVELVRAMTALMAQVHADSVQITEHIVLGGLQNQQEADSANETSGHADEDVQDKDYGQFLAQYAF
ncbi:MAG: hypothetical protein NDI60_00575 [Elusimicrobiales bacterium]|nr:hypothetical protein [Elusimicrobiales bacterium]